MASDEKSNNGVLKGLKLRHTLPRHEEIYQLAWSPDGSILASAHNGFSNGYAIRLWDPKTGENLRTISHSTYINSIAWSPDGSMLASGSYYKIVGLWDPKTGESLGTLLGHSKQVRSVAWSPDGSMLASGSDDKTVRLWDPKTGESLHTLSGHSDWVRSVAWSPDGSVVASGSDDKTVRLWDPKTGESLGTLSGYDSWVRTIAWSPDGSMLVSGSDNKTICFWNPTGERPTDVLEGHTGPITDLSFSYDGNLLASKAYDGTVRIWHVHNRQSLVSFRESAPLLWWAAASTGLAFHPHEPILASLDQRDRAIRIWDLDVEVLQENAPATPALQYANAKVVLVGDSGVGKTGLSLALTRQPFVATESTHGRHVWSMDRQEIDYPNKRKELREILLWDLAGQSGYRLVHQLHLSEVTVALVVFDFHSETNPFAGVGYWAAALHIAELFRELGTPPMKKFLVAARVDRSGRSVSRERMNEVVRKLEFDGYFETSAREGTGITELQEAIKRAIDWDMFPKRTSTDLFQRIKAFLAAEKEGRRLLSTREELYQAFLRFDKVERKGAEDVRAQFETCVGFVEASGLIRRLSFGNLVLLQPELLDAYTSALINAVRDEPDGLGSIAEDQVRVGNFAMPADERLRDKEQEKLLLLAMIEDLLRFEIALREQGNDGPYLIFPSQSTRENPDLPNPEGKAVIFDFEGPVKNIYAALAVRLSHSGLFEKKELWKNAVTYTTSAGGNYGLFLRTNEEDDGHAELTLFFDKAAGEEMRFHFEEFVNVHLQRHAIPERIRRRRMFVCSECQTPMDDLQVQKRKGRGLNSMTCGVCDATVSLLDREERLKSVPSSLVEEMDSKANERRERSAEVSILEGKIATGDFDVFLCHNGQDKASVKQIGEKLKEHGILPWLDEWELRPGLPWQRILEERIGKIKVAAVFIGRDGIGPWQQMELEGYLRRFVNKGCPVIPVILEDAPRKPDLPMFLEGMTWVDFRKAEPDPMKRLVWGITGERNMLE